MEKNLKKMGKFRNSILETFSKEKIQKARNSSELFKLIESSFEDLEKVGMNHIKMTNSSVCYQVIAFSFLVKGGTEIKTEHLNDMTLILNSIGNAESASIPRMIGDISKIIHDSNMHEEFLEVENGKASSWMNINCPEALKAYQKFMQRNGHRSLNELDLRSKTWEMESDKIIQMIKMNLKAETFDETPRKILSHQQILAGFKTPLRKSSKFILSKLIPKCQESVKNREESKSNLIHVVNTVRQAVIELSHRMVKEGLLPSCELIFFLSWQEIQNVIESRQSSLISKAIRREKIVSNLNVLKFEDISFGVPRKMLQEDLMFSQRNVLVRGVPICGGVVTGKACVIKTYSDIEVIEKGSILITYCTDIAWSPLFPVLGGLCTEIGGILSHGATVAREVNLPAIVGAAFATEKIKNGQTITLNANEGVITVF